MPALCFRRKDAAGRTQSRTQRRVDKRASVRIREGDFPRRHRSVSTLLLLRPRAGGHMPALCFRRKDAAGRTQSRTQRRVDKRASVRIREGDFPRRHRSVSTLLLLRPRAGGHMPALCFRRKDAAGCAQPRARRCRRQTGPFEKMQRSRFPPPSPRFDTSPALLPCRRACAYAMLPPQRRCGRGRLCRRRGLPAWAFGPSVRARHTTKPHAVVFKADMGFFPIVYFLAFYLFCNRGIQPYGAPPAVQLPAGLFAQLFAGDKSGHAIASFQKLFLLGGRKGQPPRAVQSRRLKRPFSGKTAAFPSRFRNASRLRPFAKDSSTGKTRAGRPL